MMRHTSFLLLAALFMGCHFGHGQPAPVSPDYNFTVPGGWRMEHIPFPIPFAPTISYTGTENAYFPAGWGDKDSQDYWSYAFVWWLNGSLVPDTAAFRQNLETYYGGLLRDNIGRRNIPASKVVPVRATVSEAQADSGDTKTYTASVQTLDYMLQVPITLYCLIHVKGCGGPDHTAIVVTVSPKGPGDSIWQRFSEMNRSFGCK